jgi:hypothetical protein
MDDMSYDWDDFYYNSAPWFNSSEQREFSSIKIHHGVKSIGEGAFYACSNFKSIEIPNSVTSIGDMAFCGCTGLTSIEICNSVRSIGNYAFSYCSGLTSITIPNSVTSIGDIAFKDCSGLKEVHINDLSAWCNISFNGYSANPLCYAKNLYLNGKLVTNLVIPDDVKEIKKYAFYNCRGLTSITIPNSVTSIGGSAFDGCSGLYMVHINNLDAWNNISFDNYYANPLNNSNAKLYLNGVEVK